MPRRKRPQVVEFRLRLYRGQDDELIDWLEQFDERPYGAKTQAVKEVLLRGIGADLGRAAQATQAMDLAEVRRVVEAAVTTALSRFACTLQGEGQAVTPIASLQEDDETEGLLDALEAALVLGGEEK